jgi:hypothetical protein
LEQANNCSNCFQYLLAGQIYYPAVPGVVLGDAHKALMVVNATDAVKRFAASSRDFGAVLTGLLGDLGSARRGLLGAAFSAFAVGAALGVEVVSLRPFWLDSTDEDEVTGVENSHEGALEDTADEAGPSGGIQVHAVLLEEPSDWEGSANVEEHNQRVPPSRRRLATSVAGAPA